MRNRKSGLTSSRSSAARMPASKSPSARARLIETDQRLHVVGRHRPAIRAPRQRRQDLRRACGFVAARSPAGTRRCADGSASPAGTRPLYGPPISSDEIESSARRHVAFTIPDRDALRSQPFGLHVLRLDDRGDAPGEGRPSAARAPAALSSASSRLGSASGPPPIVNCPTRAPSTRISIVARRVQAADDAGVGPHQPDPEDVLAVDREVVARRDAAARAERESLRPGARSARARSARSSCPSPPCSARPRGACVGSPTATRAIFAAAVR